MSGTSCMSPELVKEEEYLRNFSHLPPSELQWLRAAYRFTEQKFRGKLRDSGEPRFVHGAAMSLIALKEFGVKDLAVHLTCLGHDIVEDTTETTWEEIMEVFGKEAGVAIVDLSIPRKSNGSKTSDQLRELHYARLRQNPNVLVQVVSIFDCLHNLRTLDFCSKERIERTILRACRVSIPMIEGMKAFGIDCVALYRAYASAISRYFTTGGKRDNKTVSLPLQVQLRSQSNMP